MNPISFKRDGLEVKHRSAPGSIFHLLLSQRELLAQLIWRDIALKYRGSLFGIIWAALNPLLMLSLYTLVFGVFLKSRWPGASNSVEFSVILFSGLILFNLFSECLNRSPTLLAQNVNLIKKVIFPIELLSWMTVGTALFHAAVSLLVWLLFSALVFGYVHATVLLLPLILVPLVLISVGMGWIVSSLGVYLRDIGQVMGVVTSLLMFLSPIFYSTQSLPPGFGALLRANPLTFIIDEARSVMIAGSAPHWGTLAIYWAASLAFLWLCYAWFQRARRGFADVL